MKLYTKILNEYTEGIMGYSALTIILSTCLGSIAVMLVQMNGNSLSQILQLITVTCLCMFYNVTILSQQKPKISFNALLVGLFLITLIIGYNLKVLG